MIIIDVKYILDPLALKKYSNPSPLHLLVQLQQKHRSDCHAKTLVSVAPKIQHHLDLPPCSMSQDQQIDLPN